MTEPTFIDPETIEEKIDWMCSSAESIRVNDVLRPGRVVCIVPDREMVGRWNIVADYATEAMAVAFAAGYCHRRDSQIADGSPARSR